MMQICPGRPDRTPLMSERKMRLLRRLFTAFTSQPPVWSDAPLAPQAPFYAIGDIHGRGDLLARILDRIASDSPTPNPRVVCVGDYVDRGEDSAGVLRRLHALTQDPDRRVTCLMGNHEDMMLKFLSDPATHGPRWLRNGGLQTAASFGVGQISESTGAHGLINARDRLRGAMGDAMESWLRALPASWTSGNVTVVHAGADPARALSDQDRSTLIWGHASFLTTPRTDGNWLVFGHTVMAEPYAKLGRIAIDTGAYATGRLTAVRIGQNTARFLQA